MRNFASLRSIMSPKILWIGALALLILLSMVVYAWAEKEVTVQVDGTAIEVKSFGNNVGDALAKAGVNLGEKDTVFPGLDTSLQDGLQIVINRSFMVDVAVDGKVLKLEVPPIAVGEALKVAGVALGPMDRVEPGVDSLLQGPGQVKVIRVKEETINQDREVPFSVEKLDDDKLERGIRRVVQRGKTGMERQVVKVTYEDGKIVRQDVLERKTLREPVKQVVATGTITVASRGGQSFRFREAMEVSSTAYTYTGHNTSSGESPTVGIVAVDPEVIPLGTRLYVEGYGFATAMDTGGAIRGNRLDVFMESQEDCRHWGRRTVKVYILE